MILDGDIFAYNLKRLLKMNGIRNIELAKHLGVSKSAISNYLSGTSVPKVETIARIALFFDVGMDVLLKDYIDKPKSEVREGDKISFVVPLFYKQLQGGIVVFRNDNYQGEINCPFPLHKDYQCYAVMSYDNDMASYGITERSVAVFSVDEAPSDGELAAVFIRSLKTIVIRSVQEDDEKITLTCDKGVEYFKKTAIEYDAVVLGKIICATFNPNK